MNETMKGWHMRCIPIYLGLLLSLPQLAAAQTTLAEPHFPSGIPSDHPRIYWNAARLAQARTWYASHPFEAEDGTEIDRANPIDNAFKYLLTGQEEYCDIAKTWALAALDTIPITGSTGCDECRWYGGEIIIVYDWCHDTLTSTEAAAFDRLTDMLLHWNADGWGSEHPYGDGDGVPFSENNYFWGYFRNNLLWGIASYGDNERAEEFITNAIETRWEGVIRPHFAECNPHGVPFEGTDYGHYMVNYMLYPLITAELLGRPLIAETEYYKGAVFNFIYNMPQGLTYATPSATTPLLSVFPYGDSHDFVKNIGEAYYGTGPGQRIDVADFMKVMAARHDGRDLARYARRWINVTKVGVPDLYVKNAIAALDPGTEDKDFSNLPLDYYAAGTCIAQAHARSGWSANDTAVHFQLVSPPSLGHEHVDTGNWQMWRKGRWLALEASGRAVSGFNIPGYGDNGTTDIAESLAHNVVLFAGKGHASSGTGVATLRRLETNTNYFYAVADLTPAYHSTLDDARYGNPAVGHEEREFIFVRPLEALVILDRMQSSGSNTRKGFIVHAQAPFQPSGTGSYVATNGDQALRLTTVLPASPTYRTIDETSDTLPYPHRIEVETSGTGIQYFLHVAQARDASGPDLSVTLSESTEAYDLTIEHPTRGCSRIMIQKGLSSTGGQFGYAATCGAVTTAALTPDVERLDITEDGPVWAGLADAAPQVTTTAPLTATTGISYIYDVNATGVPTPTYSLTSSPAGMTINANSGVITWPNPSPLGPANVTVVATNSVGTATQSFTIVVAANVAPTSGGAGSTATPPGGGSTMRGGTNGTVGAATAGTANTTWTTGGGKGAVNGGGAANQPLTTAIGNGPSAGAGQTPDSANEEESSGCGCRTAGRTSSHVPALPLLTLGLALLLRRSPRRRRH